VMRHLIIGPGPCNFEIHKYRLFLESVCVGKQEIGLISDSTTNPSSLIIRVVFEIHLVSDPCFLAGVGFGKKKSMCVPLAHAIISMLVLAPM